MHNCVYNLAETRGWLSSEQADFRKLRSSVDQIFCITQTISDLYQAAKPQHSLMAFLEFSKALEHLIRFHGGVGGDCQPSSAPCDVFLLVVTQPTLRLTPINSTRKSTLNALAAERSRKK